MLYTSLKLNFRYLNNKFYRKFDNIVGKQSFDKFVTAVAVFVCQQQAKLNCIETIQYNSRN